ncbi:MAG: thiamine pyrophosphate-binding protein [Dehalococcoidia bacterium]|nr:thiamine pyrophosphate-binding protein [Dehalococcoidia bacterium]MDW8120296.1 thiamine pyrophosphate-binding protein [Chloroflexota bacterium]
MQETGGISADRVVEAFRQCGVTHIVWLPDSETGFLYEALREEKSITLVPVAREGESMAVAAGLWMGGKVPLVLIQSTGFFESGDSIRGVVLDLNLPLVMCVGYRGYEKQTPRTQRADSAAVYLEPIVQAWGIPYYLVENDEDTGRIVQAFQEAQRRQGPVAVLMCTEYTAQRRRRGA